MRITLPGDSPAARLFKDPRTAPKLPAPDTTPYELNPRTFGSSVKAPKTVSNAEDYRNARKAIAARPKSKPATSSKSSSASSAGGSLGGSSLGGGSFGGGGLGGGSSNPYLDVIGNMKDDRTFSDYMAEANKIYKPSLDYLNQQKADATARGGQFDSDLASMYEALVGNINAQQPRIAQNYDDAINQQNQITSNATSAVGNNYQRSQAQQMAMLKQLGIEAAAPETLQTGQDSQAFFQSLLNTQGAAGDQFLNSQKVAAQDFNTAQSNIAAQTGTNARSDLKMQLQDILGQLSGKGADLQTQINQQAVQMQSGAAQGLLDQQKMMMDAIRYNNDDQMDMAKFQETMANNQANLSLKDRTLQAQIERNRADAELGAAKLKNSSSSSAPKIDSSNIWDALASKASGLYGGNSSQAATAIRALQDTARSYGGDSITGKPSYSSFLNTLLSRVSPSGRPTGGGDTNQLTQLATLLYDKLYN